MSSLSTGAPASHTRRDQSEPREPRRFGRGPATDRPEPRPLTPADLSRVVDLHTQLLPHGFFVELGPAFLRAYYRLFLESPDAFAVAVRRGGVVAGALVGTLDHDRHARWTTPRLPGLALTALGALARRPRLVGRFLRARLRRYCCVVGRRVAQVLTGAPPRAASGPADRLAVLCHVFVDPDQQGLGLGAALVDAFLDAARASGAKSAELVTLDGDEGAGDFYRAHGWRACGTPHTVDGYRFQRYVFDL